jgi:crotonobetainyl-CoA:carnitine CoA-transferase CaiB-like acyl-CoA transferase
MTSEALSHIRICDFTGQLAGAGATRWMAAFGAQIIRIEDPVRKGRWDILRGSPPFKDERRGVEFGSGFNNHNIEKLGITLNLRTDRGRDLVRELVAISDAVAENFASGVLDRLGLGYEELRRIRPDIVYVSNCGFGQTGPYRDFKSWGPIAQAVSGLTHTSGLAGQDPAGWGYSYMDHTGGYYMAIALLMALWHRQQTGEGQWVDMSCSEAGASLHGPDLLDWSVNGRAQRAPDRPDSNRSTSPEMAPHGVYKCRGDDNWVAIACRDDRDWEALRSVVASPDLDDPALGALAGRMAAQDRLDEVIGAWTAADDRWSIAQRLQDAGVPAAAVARPAERIDGDLATASWGLWPMVEHRAMGGVRVDGEPVHFSKTDWEISHGAPVLGQHNHYVFGELLGLSDRQIDELADEGVI